VGHCDCVTDAHRCVSLNGAGEECGHDISIHSSVAADQKCLMTGCGCLFFTMLGLLHPSRHQVNCTRFVSVATPQMVHKNEFMKVLAERRRAQDALQGINTPREAAPPQVAPRYVVEDAWAGLNVDALRALRRACERPGNLTLPRAAVTDLLDRIAALESANVEFASVPSQFQQCATHRATIARLEGQLAETRAELAESEARIEKMGRLLDDNYRKRLEKE
jgi:hypothetical protein